MISNIDLNKNYNFSFPTDITFGVGSSNSVFECLEKNNLNSPLIVTDKSISELDIFKNFLKQNRLKENIFCDLKPNPDENNVLDGLQVYINKNCDSVVAFGGGAAIDVAKAIALKVNHDRPLFDYDDALGGDKYIEDKIPYFIAIPTTAGTGSEVGRSSVISDSDGIKKVIFSPYLLPKKVYLDPELTMKLPAHITAAVGIDALTHNLEAYLVDTFHPLCDGIALEGIKLVIESLEKSVNNPCLISKSKMMLASSMGSIAFQKGLGVVHSMAHSLSTVLGLHHGLANAIMLRIGMDFNQESVEEKFQTIMKYCNLTEKFSSFGEYISYLNNSIGIVEGLKKYNVTKDQFEKLVEVANSDLCHHTNPKKVTKEDFKKLYGEAL